MRIGHKPIAILFAGDDEENGMMAGDAPAGDSVLWKTTEQTGFEEEMELEDSEETLHLLVEKDFTCLDKVEEDQSDNYPNPLLKESYD